MRSCFQYRKMLVWFRVALCLAIYCVGLKAEVTVENRAYHNLLISFAPNVASENGKSIIDSLQALLEETSKTLHTAIGVRIATVTFRLPDTWTLDEVTTTPATVAQSRTSPDFLVDSTEDSAFGKGPFTLQYGGCGVPGHQITVPVDFLNATNEAGYPNGKLLAREWLKYRYGVFDENGFAGDTLYPSQYSIPGSSEVIVTHCTDPEVDFYFKDQSGNNCTAEEVSSVSSNCTGHPDPEGAVNVNSSLMYFHESLNNVDQVCGGQHPHNEETPSKHNILCAGRSIWDIIKISADFKSHEQSGPYEEVQFSYAQESKPRVVVVWEDSERLQKQGDWIKFAVRRLLYDLPEDSECALYTAHEEEMVNEVRPLSAVNDGTRDQAIRSEFNPADAVCTTCALAVAVEVLLDNNTEEQGTIILIVGSKSSENSELFGELAERLKKSQICLVVIAFGNTDTIAANYDPFVSASTCGSSFTLDGDQQQTFDIFLKHMQSSVPETFSDTKTDTVTTGVLTFKQPITIQMDNPLDKLILWVGTDLSNRSIACNSGDEILTLTQETDAVIGGMVSFRINTMNVEVQCSLKYDKPGQVVLTQAQMISKPGEYFVMDSWIYDTTQESDPSQMPVIIYAKLNFGRYPVALAQVKATVTSSKHATHEIRLIDSGLADPDITQYDGIYSGYFMEFDGEGEYDVAVTVSGEEKALIPKDGSDQCCGKEVEAKEWIDTPPFMASSDISFTAKSAKPVDGYRPSRIIDLRVDSFDLPKSLVLKWTAPGGGKAQSYIIRLFTSRFAAIHNFTTSGELINVTLIPAAPGITETIDIQEYILDDHTVHYLGIRSANDKDLESETSNILAFSSEGILGTTGIESSTEVIDVATKSGMSKETIGIIIGVLVLVIVIIALIYLAIYFFGRRRKQEDGEEDRKGKTVENGAARSSTGASFGLNSIPADVIIKHHNDVVTAKREHKDPPIFKEENLDTVQATPRLNESDDGDNGFYSEVQGHRNNVGDSQVPVGRNTATEYSLVQKRGPDVGQPDPRKSPKRMTVV